MCKKEGQPPATSAKSEGQCPKDNVLMTMVLSRLPNSSCRGTLDHSLAHATFPKDEIRREHAHNGPKIIKRSKDISQKGYATWQLRYSIYKDA